jgi:threonine synthase
MRTVAVESDFDTCQSLVKQCFEDAELKQRLGLNSANSINIARLLAQVCYYFEAGAAVRDIGNTVLCVPSGNFGNVTAGLVARRIGLPCKRIIAATNVTTRCHAFSPPAAGTQSPPSRRSPTRWTSRCPTTSRACWKWASGTGGALKNFCRRPR